MKTKILLTAGLLLSYAGLLKAQTRDYVQTDVVKVNGIKTDSALFALGVSGRQTSRVFIDGLGRQAQTVVIKASPNQSDLVQPVAYDSLGRNSKAYLPYTAKTSVGDYHPNALTEQHSFYNGGMNSTVARDTSPYSKQLFENSPLQRVYEVGSIGTGFQPVSGQHFKTADYRTNTAADSVVVWLPDGSSSGYYSAGALMVTYGKDEQNNQAYTFNNDNGQLVLKRQQGPSGTWLNTYYIYNDAGQAIYIVPPKASVLMKTAGSYSLSVTGADKLLFKMTYDYRGRMTVKKVPSAGEMYVVYDPLNRPVLMQDANLRAGNKWNYIKYDVKGRAISQGIYTDATSGRTTLTGMQSYVTGLSTYNTYYYEDRTTSSTYQYYTNNSFPNSNTEPLAYSYYDDYHITNTNTPDYAYAPQGLSGEAAADTMVNGMLTAVRKRTVGSGISNVWLMNVVFYDKDGRTIQSQSNNQLHTSGTPDKSTIVLDFTGKPMLTKTVKISSSSDSIRVQTAYTYDHADRVTTIDQSYNGGTSKRIAAYAYNELGQLIKKNLGRLNSGTSYPYDVTLRNTVIATTNTIAQNSIRLDSGFHATAGSSLSYTAKIKTDYLQALDYRYNIRGQLLSMNNATLTADTTNNADVNDVFGMEMLYDKADGGLGNTAYYNGRLSAVKWMTRNGTAYGAKSAQKAYNYSYDELNRLTDANYYDKATGGSWTATGAYDEKSISYDANGNILSLKRNGVLSGLVKRIDSLVYSYDGNQLTNVTDGTGSQFTANGFKNLAAYSGSTPYSYDDNGNLTGDLKKGITNHFNILNRVDSMRITGTNKYISYTYNSDGTLLRKKQYNSSGTLQLQTDYIDGFVYEGGSLVYFAAAEGRVRDSANVLTNEYVITDTQGNSRVSFEDNGSGIAKVRQENSYYPFGLIMGNGVTPANNANKHLYNGGSEWQNDYADLPDYYQTFYRNYDATIGRFVGVDPQAASAESWTVYQYAYNNPGMLNDPMGDLANGNDQGIPRSHNPEQYLQSWIMLQNSEEYREYRDDLLGNNGPTAQRIAMISNNIGFQTAGAVDYGVIARVSNALQGYGMYLDNSQIGLQRLGDGYIVSFNTLGNKYTFTTNGQEFSLPDIVNHTVFINSFDGRIYNDGPTPLTHDEELAKYGKITFASNINLTLAPVGGEAYEYGVVGTNSGWRQDYKTIYKGVVGYNLSLSVNHMVISSKDATFSDFGGWYAGLTLGYGYGSLQGGISSNYKAFGAGVGIGWTPDFLKAKSGGLQYGETILVGQPYNVSNQYGAGFNSSAYYNELRGN